MTTVRDWGHYSDSRSDLRRASSKVLAKAGIAAMTLLMIGGTAAPALAQRGRDNDDRVCFYKDAQYQGQSRCYRPGDELADLRDQRNEISSIRVFGRARVVVYDEREFAGTSDEFDMDVPDLSLRNMEGRRSWNDRIESFTVVDDRGRGRGRGRGREEDNRTAARDRICVFEDTNFRGRSQCWDAGEEEANLNRTNGWNDQISSIRVFGRAAVDVYREANFRGGALRVNRDIADLGSANFSDQISSFRVR